MTHKIEVEEFTFKGKRFFGVINRTTDKPIEHSNFSNKVDAERRAAEVRRQALEPRIAVKDPRKNQHDHTAAERIAKITDWEI